MNVNPGTEAMSDDSATGLPASIEEAWGLRGRPKRGPKPGLGLDQIVGAAVRVASAEGLAAVSMSRVARELGSAPMSLYRYVTAKDELLALMVDAVLGPAPDPPAEDGGWRAGLSRWAWGYHAVLRRHLWVLRIPISGPAITPNQTAWLEAGLSSLRETGLAEGEKLSVMLLLSGYVRSEATLVADLEAGAAAAGAGEIMPAWAGLLRRLTDPERFPALHAALASEVFSRDDDPDDEFTFGLERLLDGVDTLVRRRTG